MMFNWRVPLAYWVNAFTTVVHTINWVPTKILNNKSPFRNFFSQTHILIMFGCLLVVFMNLVGIWLFTNLLLKVSRAYFSDIARNPNVTCVLTQSPNRSMLPATYVLMSHIFHLHTFLDTINHVSLT